MRVVEAVLLGLFVILLVIQPVFSLGLAHEYLENRTLVLEPGDQYFFKLIIQNNDPEDVTVNVTLNSEIASLIGGGVIEIPANTFDKFVYFNISLPQNATPGRLYTVNYVVTPMTAGDGQVTFQVKYDRKLRVRVAGEGEAPSKTSRQKPGDIEQVVSEPEEAQESPFWNILLIIVIAILILLIWRRSNMLSEKVSPKSTVRKAKLKSVPAKKSEKSPENPGPLKTKDGLEIKTLEDLRDALKIMSPDEFKHHVNSKKNDFSDWAKSQGRNAIASKLAKATSKEEMIKVLNNALK